jgi:hypothetical protein
MQNRGDLIQDEIGQWHEGEALNWQTLPARVEAVITRRVERLSGDLRAILDAASVVGNSLRRRLWVRCWGWRNGRCCTAYHNSWANNSGWYKNGVR